MYKALLFMSSVFESFVNPIKYRKSTAKSVESPMRNINPPPKAAERRNELVELDRSVSGWIFSLYPLLRWEVLLDKRKAGTRPKIKNGFCGPSLKVYFPKS